MFGRVKPLDAILATAEKKSLHRSLGAFQLTFLTVGIMAMLAAAIGIWQKPHAPTWWKALVFLLLAVRCRKPVAMAMAARAVM